MICFTITKGERGKMERKKLFEYSAPECKVLEEKVDEVTKDRVMRVEVKWQHADKLNGNGRIYPRSILEREIERFKPLIAEGRASGCSFHPVGEGKIDDITHLWENIWMEQDGACMGVIRILPTDKGRNAQVLIRNGGHIGLSSRGVGTVSPKRMAVDGIDEKEVEVVNEDFSLESPGDFVLTPSVPDAGIRKVLESKFNENDNIIVEGEKNMDKAIEELKKQIEVLNDIISSKDDEIKEMRGLLIEAESALSDVVDSGEVDQKTELDRGLETITAIVRILQDNGYIQAPEIPPAEAESKEALEKIESLQNRLADTEGKLKKIEEDKLKLELDKYIVDITAGEKFGNVLRKKLTEKNFLSKEKIDEELKSLKSVISAAVESSNIPVGKGVGKTLVEDSGDKDAKAIKERLKALANIK